MLIRRSILELPLAECSSFRKTVFHASDAVAVNLRGKEGTSDNIQRTIMEFAASAVRGGPEPFLSIEKVSMRERLELSLWPGIRGLMLHDFETPEEILDCANAVSVLEKQRKIPAGSIEFILLLSSARAIWEIRALLEASPRLKQIGLDEVRLASSLGIRLRQDIDPFEYARGRLIVEAISAGVSPIGMAFPLSALPHEAAAPEVHELACKARNLGMKGVVCPFPDWVAPVNRAFTPTAELVAYNRRVREAFAAGVAKGTAAVALDGRMIDVPVDEWAATVLAMAEACAKRDAEKNQAYQSLA